MGIRAGERRTRDLHHDLDAERYGCRGRRPTPGLDRTSPTTVTGVLKRDEIHRVGMASTGILKVSGNEMTGTLQCGGQPARLIARRQTD